MHKQILSICRVAAVAAFFAALPGVTVALTPNVDLYAEYVKWTVDPANGPKVDYEDGYQLILNWRF